MPTPPPTARHDVDIDDEQVEFFQHHGYLAVDDLVPPEELDWLRATYEDVFARRQGIDLDGAFDVTRPYLEEPDDEGQRFTQVLMPEITVPDLRRTAYARNGRRIAAKLLGKAPDEVVHWGHMLTKPGRIGYAAPWHQDEAYWDPAKDYVAVGAWMPLDDATVDNGCLWFVPGSHLDGVRRHRHLGGDPAVHLLELDEDVDLSGAVAVPVKAGSVTFHHSRMLHYSRPNTMPHDRRAYANEFQTVPVRREVPADRPWYHEGTAAYEATVALVAGGSRAAGAAG